MAEVKAPTALKSMPSRKRVQATTWLLLPRARLRTCGEFGKHQLYTQSSQEEGVFGWISAWVPQPLNEAYLQLGPRLSQPSLASAGTTSLEIWSPTVRRRQTPPWVPSIWVEPLRLWKQCELHENFHPKKIRRSQGANRVHAPEVHYSARVSLEAWPRAEHCDERRSAVQALSARCCEAHTGFSYTPSPSFTSELGRQPDSDAAAKKPSALYGHFISGCSQHSQQSYF